MSQAKGFTLIELIIVVAICMIVGTVGYNFFSGNRSYNFSSGVTTVCSNGYVYVQSHGNGTLTQQMGPDGKPDRCH